MTGSGAPSTGGPATLVLVTGSYPYAANDEDTFLEPELPHLTAAFERVIVVPALASGGVRPLPVGACVDTSLAETPLRYGKRELWRVALASARVREELCRRPLALGHPRALKRLLAFGVQSEHTARRIKTLVAARGLAPPSTLFYSYWLDHHTAGLVLARSAGAVIHVVSRAHGYDLYEHTQRPAYLPLRRWLIGSLDTLFIVSEHGRAYARRYVTQSGARLAVSRLGTPDPGFLSVPSGDGVFRIVSCARLVPVKNIALLCRGLALAACARASRAIEWTHFGGGPLEAELREQARGVPSNLRCRFAGQVPAAAVMAHYRDAPVDLFANTSVSEGVPVAIMEAQSCGLPVLAPDVGGVGELVGADNGWLLAARPSADDVGRAIVTACETPEASPSRRAAARRRWEALGDARANLARFARELRTFVE